MDREQTLHEFLQSRLSRAIFVVDPPNAAGVHFEELDEWRVVIHVGQLVAMSEVLTDEQFNLFAEGVAGFAAFTLANIPSADDLDDAIFQAQTAMAARFPVEYMLMDQVFALD